ncbi:hypothetical protein K503DRAFT_788324, partial [Rhizopogon vinicolor AM-OR11-026]
AQAKTSHPSPGVAEANAGNVSEAGPPHTHTSSQVMLSGQAACNSLRCKTKKVILVGPSQGPACRSTEGEGGGDGDANAQTQSTSTAVQTSAAIVQPSIVGPLRPQTQAQPTEEEHHFRSIWEQFFLALCFQTRSRFQSTGDSQAPGE